MPERETSVLITKTVKEIIRLSKKIQKNTRESAALFTTMAMISALSANREVGTAIAPLLLAATASIDIIHSIRQQKDIGVYTNLLQSLEAPSELGE